MATPLLELAAARGVVFPLRTERLTLTPYAPGDAERLFHYWALEEVHSWTSRSYADAAELDRVSLERADRLVVRRTEDGAVLGDLKLTVQDAWSHPERVEEARDTQAELGWTFDPAHHGRGYATEAVRELVRVCFAELGLRRIEAHCFADNEPSWRLMDRVGMRREGVFVRESLHASRGWVDGMSYGLLAEEWAG